ncbi:MAG TPA: ATP-binding protein [Gemmatimonadales bacterium]|nr:ATP-binding protein [Gemmatimonadales bacterium]
MKTAIRDLPIGRKVTLLIVVASALSLLLAAAGVLLYDLTTLRPRVIRDLTTQVELMRANTTAALVFDDPEAARENLSTLRARPEIPMAAIFDSSGHVFASYLRDQRAEFQLKVPTAEGAVSDPDYVTVSQRMVSGDQALGWIEVRYELPSLWARLPQYGLLVAVVLLALLAVSLLLDRFLRGSIIAPLFELAATARAVSSRKDYGLRARKHGDDEIGRVTSAFNEMLDTIQSGEAALRESARRLQEAMQAARMIAWSWDPETGAIVWGSGTMPEDFALLAPVRSLEGLLELTGPGDRDTVREELDTAIRTGAPCEFDIRLVAPDGRHRWLTLRGQPEVGPDGKMRRVVGLAMDITDRRRLEEQLVQSQRLEAIGRLAGGVAHDFNNLLTAILGYANFALRGLPPGSSARADIEAIERAGQRAASLTGQLLAYARRQMVVPRVVDLGELLTGMEGMLQRIIGEDIHLTTRIAPDLWRARIDPTQFEQVVLNLVVNARDAMPGGGTLTLEVSNRVIDPVYADGHSELVPGSYVMLEVADTGTGMDPDTRARIFEPFFTTKEQGKGTGLGLAVCYGIVRQASGSISVYSEPGHGSTFRMLLPRADVASAAEPAHAEAPIALAGEESVLVVEDERWVRELAVRALRAHGYQVRAAATGEEALAIAASAPVDVLVTDVVMPGMNGRELAERLQATRPSLQVVYMSGYAEHSVVRQGVIEPGIAFVGKPFEPDRLARMVREVLDQSAAKPD